MKVILVDTNTQTISKVDVGDKLTLPKIYELIGCDCIASYQFDRHHSFYCDDEALFKKPLPPSMFVEGFNDPVYGRIIVFRPDGEGNEISPTISIQEVFSKIFFLPQK